ncbi:RNA polymerase sigma-70 factor [Chitinophaga agrisoli]|uniref:RNA polymerase sigma-70 factor n=1 Tax=Chitinophaga agrisoli TaxID=2607653 RepID=A0A5B2VMD8_9BACT|nr:RNA polymerase sigma-70 factor [Chitinophaga agrisoli]KAA2239810.1 RNA polymerase sigma-70 factor [Chitinophaga agrisoli]
MESHSEVSDLQLVAEMKLHQHKAYETLYNRYAAQLYLLAANKLQSKEIAEELVHDVFIKFWEKREQIEIQSNVAGYLFKMLRNEILQYFRSSATSKTVFIEEMMAVEVGDKAGTADHLYAKDLETRLSATIDALPEKCREIFIMSRQQDLSVKEIAGRLDIADQTVKNQLTKALTIIRKELKHITYFFF